MDENTYSSVVMSAMMQKLPENFRLTITRGEEFLTWSMKMLEAFLKELDLREDHFYAVNPSNIGKENRLKGGTASALHTKQDNANGAFCLGKHAHENCHRIKDTKERKSILRANVCNFRESVDSREFLNCFIFCPNNLYSTLISKITLKLVTAFYFFRNQEKFEKL